jgi:hypothetical protein
MAVAQGINQRRVKVLPVRFGEVEMPATLVDTYWADARVDNVDTVANRLTVAMTAHLNGREAEAAEAARQAEPTVGQPPHAEVVGDVGVAQIEDVAQRTWDVFSVWVDVWAGNGNTADMNDPQRRLRWALDALPERVRPSLPLVHELATSDDWTGFLVEDRIVETETDVRDELRSARTRVAQGLPITARWIVAHDHGEVHPGDRDATAYHWGLRRGQEERQVTVFISGSAMHSENDGLPAEVVQAKITRGRSVMSTLIGLDDPPRQVGVSTAGIQLTLPE